MSGIALNDEPELHASGSRKPILVTGLQRSGTTWAGKMIAQAPGNAYVHEPFNPEMGPFNPVTKWYLYVSEENSLDYEKYLNGKINFTLPLTRNLAHSARMRQIAQSFRESATSAMHRLTNKTPVMKDPMAALSAPWLARRFDFTVLVMLRHPAAFCSSQKFKNWKFDFNNFLIQPNLLRDTSLGALEPEIRYYAENPQDVISQAPFCGTALT